MLFSAVVARILRIKVGNHMAIKIQNRHDTTLNWTTYNPVLAVAEIGYDEDLKLIKVGDGVSTWNELMYMAVSGSADGGGVTGSTGSILDGGGA